MHAVESLETALDAERRRLMHANKSRLAIYADAAQQWSSHWKEVEKETAGLALLEAHNLIIHRAEDVLPRKPAEETGDERSPG